MKQATRRHQKLMDASAYALQRASHCDKPTLARVASTVIASPDTYHAWESTHADMLVPVARHRSDRGLLTELRVLRAALVRKRALFAMIRRKNVVGERRERLLRLFHSTRDYEDSVLAEHRQFMLAMSSTISARHIARFMNDGTGQELLARYEQAFDQYFEIKCAIAMSRSRSYRALLRPYLAAAETQVMRSYNRLLRDKPSISGFSFEVQADLSRSGRFKALNYLNK